MDNNDVMELLDDLFNMISEESGGRLQFSYNPGGSLLGATETMDGVKDGTAKDDIDFGLMYLTVTHSLMLMSEKFSRGKVFDSDTGGEQELGFMVDMALYYIRK